VAVEAAVSVDVAEVDGRDDPVLPRRDDVPVLVDLDDLEVRWRAKRQPERFVLLAGVALVELEDVACIPLRL